MFNHYLLILVLLLLSACQSPEHYVSKHAVAILPWTETVPIGSNGDAADDPAIWVHPSDTRKSLILGTDKHSGLAVYNLQGEQLQFLARGRLNNVDLRQNINIGGQRHDIAVATNRSSGGLDIFTISHTGEVLLAQTVSIPLKTIYGVCLYHRNKTDLVAFVNSKNGWYQQWLLNPHGELKPLLEGEFLIASQPEGCVVNDSSNTLYFGEEDLGVWKMAADYRDAEHRRLIDAVSGSHLKDDVEGLAIYHSQQRSILVVSSQGDNSYALYDLADDRYLGSVRISNNLDNTVDAVQETDGLAVSSANFGGRLAEGLLVVQDGFNTLPAQNQNFKLVPWAELNAKLLLTQ